MRADDDVVKRFNARQVLAARWRMIRERRASTPVHQIISTSPDHTLRVEHMETAQ